MDKPFLSIDEQIALQGGRLVRRAKKYPLWVAQYPDYEETGYQKDPWTDGAGYGAWGGPLLFQYTSSGVVPGYAGHLDLNILYCGKADWQKRCKKAIARYGSPGGFARPQMASSI